MRKSKFTESQVLNLLKQAESGVPVVDICRENGISNATFYKWRVKYGGMDTSMMKRLKDRSTVRHVKRMPDAKDEIKELLMSLADTHKRWGFGLMFRWLRREGYPWNHKLVYKGQAKASGARVFLIEAFPILGTKNKISPELTPLTFQIMSQFDTKAGRYHREFLLGCNTSVRSGQADKAKTIIEMARYLLTDDYVGR